ncbi:gamma-glutamyltransferase [Legionella geestiana]|nr:gamma-glutamyltransferase [Legionella geestiana]
MNMKHTWMLFALIFGGGMVISPFTHAAVGRGMVVTSQHLASTVGRDILNAGGNAVDAAVAIGYALAVVEPCCGNLGGGGFMVIHRKNGENLVINFRETAPQKAVPARFFDAKRAPVPERLRAGGLSVATPGTVMGLEIAREKYGTFSRERLLAPAIALAEKGFILTAGDVKLIADSWEGLKKSAAVRAVFGERLPGVGERLVQSDLSKTLKTLAKEGSSAFYTGSIAAAIVKSSERHGGLLQLSDFSAYRAQVLSPLVCEYRGFTVITTPPPSSGGVVLCEMLKILEPYPLAKSGFRQPGGTREILEAMRAAYADRVQLGDPDFVKNPIDMLLSPAHIKAVRARMDSTAPRQPALHPVGNERAETTHYSVVDAEGNAVAVTYTLNGYFGAKEIAEGTGIFLNNEMDDFTLTPGVANEFGLIQGEANAIAPGKRPLSSMTPTVVLKDGTLFMVLGAPGGSTIPTQVLETLINVIDYGLSLTLAVDAPRFHMQWRPDVVFVERGAFSENTLKTLRDWGYRFEEQSPWGTPLWGAVAAIAYYPKLQRLVGAIDKRRPAGAVMESDVQSR